MKKFSKAVLKKLDVDQGDLLQKSELKNILGGYGDGGYGGYGSTDTSGSKCCIYCTWVVAQYWSGGVIHWTGEGRDCGTEKNFCTGDNPFTIPDYANYTCDYNLPTH